MTARRGDRGAVIPTVAIAMGAICAFFALAFNVGLMMKGRTQLQSASDSAALAAARSLNGEASGLLAARRAADAYSREHTAVGDTVLIDAFGGDLVFGRWHLQASDCKFGRGDDCFEPISTDEPRKITAVKIFNGRDGDASHNDPIELPFGGLVGASESKVDSAAVAVGAGAAVVECALPMVVPECRILDGAGKLACASGTPQRLVFSNANVDAIGFVNLYYPEDTQAPSGTFVADVIRNRRCNPKNHQIGTAKMQNGNDFGKVIEALRGVTNTGKGDAVTGECLIGKTQTLAVSDAGCPSNPIFQGEQEVVGFVTATITAVTDNQGTVMGCPDKDAPSLTGPFDKNAVIIDITCESPGGAGEWGGGRAYNGSGDIPVRLVQ